MSIAAHGGRLRTNGALARLLLVEDDDDLREVLTRVLQSRGYVVQAAADGAAALAEVQRDPPAAILTNLTLPVLDGWELLRAVRALPQTAAVQVVLLTSGAVDASRAAALGVGGVLLKPFGLAQMLHLVDTLLTGKRPPVGPGASEHGSPP
jgi:CheY-like chemotaxis protein